MNTYHGQCHCGAIRFHFESEPITSGLRCNCSICRRKGAVMSDEYYPPERFTLLSGKKALSCYRWNDCDVNHYFCRHCGIYPFHDGTGERQGHCRVNLGCVEGVDPLALEIRVFDGANLL